MVALHEIELVMTAVAKRWVVFENIFRQQRLAPSRTRRHSADHDARSEDDLRIAREEIIRNRRQIETWQLARVLSLVRNSTDENLGQRGRLLLGERGRQPASEFVALREIANDRAARLLVVEDLFKQILDVIDLIRDETQQLLKTTVFFARELSEQDVIKQQLGHHGRHHDVDFPPG